MAILINTIPVVGVTYDARQQRIAALEEGALVFFKAEPHNKYDPQAVAVLNENGEHLGYVGRNDPKREQIRCALANGFVVARALKVGGFKKWDGTRATYGLRVQFYTVNWMYGFANIEDKDKDDDELVPVKSSGKHPTNRWELNKKHKANDIRDIESTKVDRAIDPAYRRQMSKQRRRAFKEGYELKPNRQQWVYNYYLSDEEIVDWFKSKRSA